ncbi:MAG: TolC family protein [Deltaproteobacteria bacterium]|nr:TolC family protein [Deltaproteobacteria bacterium]
MASMDDGGATVSGSSPAAVHLPATSVAASAAASQPGALALADVLRLAAAHNENYAITDQQLVQAGLLRDRAWAALLPTLAVAGSYTHFDKQVEANNRIIQRQDTLAGNLSAQWTLFRGPAVAGVMRAYDATEAAVQRVTWTRRNLAFEVARSYFAALATDNLVRASERALITAEQDVAAARARRAAGNALAIDETRAQLELVTAQGRLTEARNTRDDAAEYLAFLTGQPQPLQLASTAVAAAEEGPEVVEVAALRQRRPDVQAAEFDLAAAEDAVRGAWLDYLPTAALTGNALLSQNTGWSGEPFSWNAVVALQWQLLDGGLRRATRLDSDASLIRARQELQLIERTVQREVKKAQRDVVTAAATLDTSRERLRLARQNQQATASRYQAGLATSLELNDTADALIQAEVAVIASELDLTLARLARRHALGLDPLGR